MHIYLPLMWMANMNIRHKNFILQNIVKKDFLKMCFGYSSPSSHPGTLLASRYGGEITQTLFCLSLWGRIVLIPRLENIYLRHMKINGTIDLLMMLPSWDSVPTSAKLGWDSLILQFSYPPARRPDRLPAHMLARPPECLPRIVVYN